MNRINRLNITGITAGAAALIASSALAVGCGPGAPMKAVPSISGTNVNYPVNTTTLPQNAQGLNDIGAFSPQQQSQINGLMGTYTGSFSAYNANYDLVDQPYVLTLKAGTSPTAAQGKNYVQANFSAGVFSFSSIMQATFLQTTYGSSGPTYAFVTLPQSVTAFDSNGPVYLIVQLTIDGNNQFDPTQSASNNGGLGPIRIVDSVSLNSVVDFYYDFQRH